MEDADAQRHDQIYPAEKRIVDKDISENSLILAFIKSPNVGMQAPYFLFKVIEGNWITL